MLCILRRPLAAFCRSRRARHLARSATAALLALVVICPRNASAQFVSGKALPLGVNIDLNEQSVVDLMQTAGAVALDGSSESVTFDSTGWPSSDFGILMDNRYIFKWFPSATNIDPKQYATNISGTWKLTFNGSAKVTGLYDTADVSV